MMADDMDLLMDKENKFLKDQEDLIAKQGEKIQIDLGKLKSKLKEKEAFKTLIEQSNQKLNDRNNHRIMLRKKGQKTKQLL